MKQKNVHRGVANLPSGEGDPNTPVLGVGKLSRIHRSYQKERSRRRSRSQYRFTIFSKSLQYFLIVIGVAFVGGLSWMIYKQSTNKVPHFVTSTLAEDTFTVPHPPASQCEQIVRSFLQASTAKEMQKFARLQHMKSEEAYQAFYEFSQKLGAVERVDWAGAEEANGLSLEMVMVTYKSGQYRIAYLIPDKKQNWFVDLEAYLGRNNRSWEQISGQGSCQAVVRVIATPEAYYNGIFSNEREWSCLALINPDHEERIYGYVRNQSAAVLAFRQLLRAKNPAPVILEISRDAGMEPMQYEIKKVIAQGWVESEVEFGSRFHDEVSDSSSSGTLGTSQ